MTDPPCKDVVLIALSIDTWLAAELLIPLGIDSMISSYINELVNLPLPVIGLGKLLRLVIGLSFESLMFEIISSSIDESDIF